VLNICVTAEPPEDPQARKFTEIEELAANKSHESLFCAVTAAENEPSPWPCEIAPVVSVSSEVGTAIPVSFISTKQH
jgi:hypothetical protein